MLTALYVIGRIVASPATNVFQKRLTHKHIDPLFIVFVTHVGLALLAAPVLLAFFPVSFAHFDLSIWLIVLAMGIFETLGNVCLVRSLKDLDISIFGPLNSFKPAIGMLLGIVVLSEIPSLYGLFGLVIILSGSLLLRAPGRINLTRNRLTPFAFRFLAMFFASLGAVLSKQVIVASNSLTALFFWIVLGVPLLGLVCLVKGKSYFTRNGVILKFNGFDVCGVILSILLMQAFTLLTFKHMFVGYALALFQLSSLLSVLFGHFFREPYIRRRLLGALVMIAGALVIIQTY